MQEKARRDGKSMGQIVRELIDIGLSATVSRHRHRYTLSEVKGLFSTHTTTGKDHDTYLYNTD